MRVQSQFIEMFGNPVTNSKSWQTKAIMEVAPEQPSKKRMQGKVWLLNLDMIESNTGKVIEKVYETSENTLSVQPFDEGNVLFSKLRPYLNKVVVPDEYGLATTELVPLRPNQEKLHKVFLSSEMAPGIALATVWARKSIRADRTNHRRIQLGFDGLSAEPLRQVIAAKRRFKRCSCFASRSNVVAGLHNAVRALSCAASFAPCLVVSKVSANTLSCLPTDRMAPSAAFHNSSTF